LKIVPQRLHVVKRVKYSGFRAGTRTYALLLGVAKVPIIAISSDKKTLIMKLAYNIILGILYYKL